MASSSPRFCALTKTNELSNQLPEPKSQRYMVCSCRIQPNRVCDQGPDWWQDDGPPSHQEAFNQGKHEEEAAKAAGQGCRSDCDEGRDWDLEPVGTSSSSPCSWCLSRANSPTPVDLHTWARATLDHHHAAPDSPAASVHSIGLSWTCDSDSQSNSDSSYYNITDSLSPDTQYGAHDSNSEVTPSSPLWDQYWPWAAVITLVIVAWATLLGFFIYLDHYHTLPKITHSHQQLNILRPLEDIVNWTAQIPEVLYTQDLKLGAQIRASRSGTTIYSEEDNHDDGGVYLPTALRLHDIDSIIEDLCWALERITEDNPTPEHSELVLRCLADYKNLPSPRAHELWAHASLLFTSSGQTSALRRQARTIRLVADGISKLDPQAQAFVKPDSVEVIRRTRSSLLVATGRASKGTTSSNFNPDSQAAKATINWKLYKRFTSDEVQAAETWGQGACALIRRRYRGGGGDGGADSRVLDRQELTKAATTSMVEGVPLVAAVQRIQAMHELVHDLIKYTTSSAINITSWKASIHKDDLRDLVDKKRTSRAQYKHDNTSLPALTALKSTIPFLADTKRRSEEAMDLLIDICVAKSQMARTVARFEKSGWFEWEYFTTSHSSKHTAELHLIHYTLPPPQEQASTLRILADRLDHISDNFLAEYSELSTLAGGLMRRRARDTAIAQVHQLLHDDTALDLGYIYWWRVPLAIKDQIISKEWSKHSPSPVVACPDELLPIWEHLYGTYSDGSVYEDGQDYEDDDDDDDDDVDLTRGYKDQSPPWIETLERIRARLDELINTQDDDLVQGDEDYYAILGVSRDASPREIRAAGIKKTRPMHPDKVWRMPDVNIDEINAAYIQLIRARTVLEDAEARAQYDAQGGGTGKTREELKAFLLNKLDGMVREAQMIL